MRLSPNSWHHKLHVWAYGGVAVRSLCPYFWLTVLAVVFSPFILAAKHWPSVPEELLDRIMWTCLFIAVGATIVGSMALMILAAGSVVLGVVYWLLIVGFGGGLIYGMIKVGDWRNTHPKPVKIKEPKPLKIRKPREPSLLAEYLKAKKNKVCPIIEWGDGE